MPFIFLYVVNIFFVITLSQESITHLYALIALPIIIFCQVVLSLLSYWNVKVRCWMQYRTVKDVKNAQYVLVEPAEHRGYAQLCPLIRKKAKNAEQSEIIFFEFQKRIYKFNDEKKTFEKPRYPTQESMQYYRNLRGLRDDDVERGIEEYGLNKFDIPIPGFWDLFKEHALAPFFVFQIFCVALWCLDDYWYYSLFTLVMLFVFESHVVKQRLNNLSHVRQMASEPINVYVLRNGKWVKITSDKLLPNDIISITRHAEGVVCPCDVLLMDGKCVVNESLLTGETTPQMKMNILERHTTEILDMKKDKQNIIFGGTRVLLHQSGNKVPPDGGCVGIVLRTGFETNQGKLIRTILFSTETVTANNRESLLFILFLLVFAVVASGYVMVKGLEDPDKSRWKLVLNCIMIITSVIPPELPVELSLAVNTSLVALSKLGIFCTEPFRIPLAGKLDVCCFDKTGTLTSDKMFLRGVTGLGGDRSLSEISKIDKNSKIVLAGCHSLISLDGNVVGDPMEKAALEGVGFKFSNDVATSSTGKIRLRILKRFAFSSDIKRMSVIVQMDRTKDLLVLTKGAPESMKPLFTKIPSDYDSIYKGFTMKGQRLIALGYKSVDSTNLTREAAEKDLSFAGFAVFESEIKPDTYDTIENLLDSSHRCIMITGDNPLTAVHVARELKFITKQVLMLGHDGEKVFWTDENDTTLPISTPTSELQNYDLCISGEALPFAIRHDKDWLRKHLPYSNVFARVAPEQKEVILTTLKSMGYHTLMCGDGTNDVGALKQADVGVALLDNMPDEEWKKLFIQSRQQSSPMTSLFKKKEPEQTPEQKKLQKEIDKKMQKKLQKKSEKERQRANAARRTPKSFQQLLEEAKAEAEDKPLIRLGDASIASPFTSKSSTIMSTATIIKQGRCTLVTTMQMYKILALNCLISAYSLSVLYLDGVKFGDGQMMITGVAIALCFLFISRSQPLTKLSRERPHTTIFSPYMMLSLLGQFAIHICVLIYAVSAAKAASPSLEKPDLEANFEPNLVNSIVFIVTSLQTVMTFLNNYKGHPFMQSLTENRPLFVVLVGLGSLLLITATDLIRPLNEMLQLVPMPSTQFRNWFCGLLLLNIAGVWVYERIISYLFRNEPPPKK